MGPGRPLNVKDEQEMLNLWNEYKKTVDDNPDEQEIATGKGVFKIKVKRPYLIEGFYCYVLENHGFYIHQYFDNVNNAYEQFLGVVSHIRSQVKSDHVDGSLTGRYKAPNLVARLHGVSEKTQNEHTGANGQPLTFQILPDAQCKPITD